MNNGPDELGSVLRFYMKFLFGALVSIGLIIAVIYFALTGNF